LLPLALPKAVIPAGAQRRAGTQGRPHCAGPWVPDKRFALSGMTIDLDEAAEPLPRDPLR